MNYAELVEKARETYESEDTPHVVKAWLLANIIYPADESEDERIRKEIIRIFKGETRYASKEDTDKYVTWLEKQGKKLDPDKVIEWLKTHGNLVPIVTIKINEVIAKFKKDFGL